MIYKIHRIPVYAPKYIGEKDILIGGGEILAIEESIDTVLPEEGLVEEIDGSGLLAAPGIIDSHLHPTGGGGEGGFSSRTPELQLSDFTTAGVTTLVGTLGTDGNTRDLRNLLAKVKALKEDGLSAYCYTGSYHLPLKGLCPSLSDDIIFIEEVIGAGEIALADHRSGQPDYRQLLELAAACRLGGMLSGKAGTVNIHMGDGKQGLSLLRQIAEQSEVPRTQFSPTHMGRNPQLFREATQWALEGGYVDFTTCTREAFIREGEVRASRALRLLLDAGVALDRISFSSDAGGSLPSFDQEGKICGMEVGDCSSLLDELRRAVRDEGISLEKALCPLTASVAKRLELNRKGVIAGGVDADIMLLDRESLELRTLFARGEIMIRSGEILRRSPFEKQER